MRQEDSRRTTSGEDPWPHTGLNVEEVVQNAMNYAMEAVEQAGIKPFSPAGWFHASAPSSSGPRTQSTSQDELHAESRETQECVVIKLRFPAGLHPRHFRFFITARALTWTGMRQERPQTVRFPSYVEKRTARAVYKDRVLHIRIRKMKTDDTAHEIYVRYTD